MFIVLVSLPLISTGSISLKEMSSLTIDTLRFLICFTELLVISTGSSTHSFTLNDFFGKFKLISTGWLIILINSLNSS